MTSSTIFVCQQCGEDYPKWFGRCPNCGEWNTLVESRLTSTSKTLKSKTAKNQNSGNKPIRLTEIPAEKVDRIITSISELDRSLGGGLVPGQVVLLAGEPGIGKSTLLLQLANTLKNAFYVSGEESTNQVSIRAKRLGVDNKGIQFMESTDVDEIVDVLERETEKPAVIIVDSIQTMTTGDLSGVAGSVGQVRESAFRFIRFAKSHKVPVILVGHVTKIGTVAGPSVLAHMVDTVLWFEGDKSLSIRMLRAMKNRFGATDEVGIFTMEEKGLVSIVDPEKIFLNTDGRGATSVPGSVTTTLMEGTRPILVEVQALVVSTKLPIPRRVASGFDAKRLEMILAVLTRRCGIALYDMDVFVNIAGGIKAKDTGIDLAVALALASSFYDKAMPTKSLAIGEVGLLGEIRSVTGQEKRIKEAKRLGYKDIINSGDFNYLNPVIKKYLR
jgi:DNA repair protein RadA/Sms